MSKALTAPMRRISKRLISKLGKTVTLTHVTPATYNPATGVSAPTETTTSVKAIVTDFVEAEFSDTILEGDIKVTIAAKGITAPDPNDKVTIDAVAHQIVNIEYIAAGATAAMYELQVRK